MPCQKNNKGKKHERDATPEEIRSDADAPVDGSTGTLSPASKRRRSTAIPQIPPVEVQSNAGAHSYIKFGKLPPSADMERQLNGLINNVPVASLVNPTVAQLFEHVKVLYRFRVLNHNLSILEQRRICRCSHSFLVECLCEPTWFSERDSWPLVGTTYLQCCVFFILQGRCEI